MGQDRDFDVGQKSVIYVSFEVSYDFVWFLNTTRTHIRIISDSHIRIVSKPYQNHIEIMSKPQKTSRNRTKACPGAVSVSFLEANPSGTLKKALRSQTMSEPYQITSKAISTP